MARSMSTADAGRLGGIRSRRHLSASDARRMVAVREARRLYRENQTLCFWWARPDLVIRAADVPWVADGLRKHGGRQAWRDAAKLEKLLASDEAAENGCHVHEQRGGQEETTTQASAQVTDAPLSS